MSDLLRLLAGPLLWFFCFCALYGLHGIGCASPANTLPDWLTPTVWRAILVSGAAASFLLQLAWLWVVHTGRSGEAQSAMQRWSIMTAWIAIIVSAWTLQPLVWMSSCV